MNTSLGPVLASALTVLVTACTDASAPPAADPVPAPADSPTRTSEPPIGVPRGPSEVTSVQQVGRYGLEVGGETVPGRWMLQDSRRDVWIALEVGTGDRQTQRWGKGTTVHPVPPSTGGVLRGGVVISPDARWIAWTRQEGYDVTGAPRVMEVVSTTTGRVRWSRDADDDAPEVGALAVTDDGVVTFAHCTEPVVDSGGWPQCDAARVEAWAPEVGVTGTVPAAVTESHGPPGTVTVLRPLVESSGADNGLLVRPDRTGAPRYVTVSDRGDIDIVARLPRNTVVVTEDGTSALTGGCDSSSDCHWDVVPLDGRERRSLKVPADADRMPFEGFAHFVAERDDLVVVQPRPEVGLPGGGLARCSLAQARCVRIDEGEPS